MKHTLLAEHWVGFVVLFIIFTAVAVGHFIHTGMNDDFE